MLVPIEVALRVYDGVFLLKMIGAFSADSIGVLGEGADARVGGSSCSLANKFEHSGVLHV